MALINIQDEIKYEAIYPKATYAPWLNNNDFDEAYKKIQHKTMVDKYRCFELWSLVYQVQNMEGSLVEVGVCEGGSGALITAAAKQYGITDPVYLCDTFKGVVKASPIDLEHKNAEHKTSSASVKALLKKLSLTNAIILKGVFPDETSHMLTSSQFRFVHIDVDVYLSAKGIMEYIWDKLVVGGVVVYDDYGFERCNGITQYVNEQLRDVDKIIIHNLNGHAVVVKTK